MVNAEQGICTNMERIQKKINCNREHKIDKNCEETKDSSVT